MAAVALACGRGAGHVPCIIIEGGTRYSKAASADHALSMKAC